MGRKRIIQEWTPELDARLIELRRHRATFAEVHKILGAPAGDAKRRLIELGKDDPSIAVLALSAARGRKITPSAVAAVTELYRENGISEVARRTGLNEAAVRCIVETHHLEHSEEYEDYRAAMAAARAAKAAAAKAAKVAQWKKEWAERRAAAVSPDCERILAALRKIYARKEERLRKTSGGKRARGRKPAAPRPTAPETPTATDTLGDIVARYEQRQRDAGRGSDLTAS